MSYQMQRVNISLCAFRYLLQMPNICVNHGMLTTLVERFHSEHNTFHLPIGEMTIMPQDIYRILRIPFDGDKIDYDSTPRPSI